jgi:transposase
MWYSGIDQHKRIQRLLWIPGLGKVNAFTIYTEIDGISRFPSKQQPFSPPRGITSPSRRGAS